MPVGTDLVFLLDETGQLVDAQLASEQAVHQSALDNKAARLMGVNRHIRAIFIENKSGSNEITVVLPSEKKERRFRIRPPVSILNELKKNQDVVLLMDDEDAVVDIATADPPPNQYRPVQGQ